MEMISRKVNDPNDKRIINSKGKETAFVPIPHEVCENPVTFLRYLGYDINTKEEIDDVYRIYNEINELFNSKKMKKTD